MATEAQIQANRSGAQKSTGPRTAEGKAVVAQNAVKHGLLARVDVIRGEDQAEFDRQREALLGELVPGGVRESVPAGRIVGLSWRLQRAERAGHDGRITQNKANFSGAGGRATCLWQRSWGEFAGKRVPRNKPNFRACFTGK